MSLQTNQQDSKITNSSLLCSAPGHEEKEKVKSIEPISLSGKIMVQNDSRIERARLNSLFEEMKALLCGRQMVFGRKNYPANSKESSPLKGKWGSSNWSDHISDTDMREFLVSNLCSVVDCSVEKVKHLLQYPLLKPAEIQTSSDLKKKVDESSEDVQKSLRERWANRVVENTKGIVFGIWNCAYTILGEVLTRELFSELIVIWTVLFMQGKFSKLWKLETTLLFCKATQQAEEPVFSDEDVAPLTFNGKHKKGFLAGGRFYRWVRSRLNLPETLRVPLFYSIMQTKRCTQSLSWQDELQSLIKHKQNMTGAAFKGLEERREEEKMEIDTDWNVVKSTIVPDFGTEGETTRAALKKIDRILSRSLRHKRSVSWRPPSINSTFTHSRKSCGAQGWFSQFFESLRPIFVGYIEEGWKPVPIYAPVSLVEEIHEFYALLKQQDAEFDRSPLISLPAQIHTVLEPLKARIITSGDAPTYHWARMLQKSIHGSLRKDRYMELMGKRHCSSLFEEHFVGKIVPAGWFWVAGDYDAATDGMNPTVSLGYCSSIGRQYQLDPLEVKRFKSTMCGHLIHYPDWAVEKAKARGENLEPVLQTWGQLMGSPSSFPALCTINMAGFWVAVERYEKRVVKYEELEKYCVMVNGDDIVFISDPTLYQIWKDTMVELGLTPSIGKNFQARNWMMINSTCYWIEYAWSERQLREHNKRIDIYAEDWEKEMEEEIGTDEPEEVVAIKVMDHIDPGLVAGLSKVQSDTRRDDMSDLDVDAELFATCAKLRQAISTISDPEQVDRMTESFFYHNGKALRASKRSWTLPDTLGGLGLPGDCNTSTVLQKLVALRVAGMGWFDPEEIIQCKILTQKLDARMKLSKPQTERGDAIPAFLLSSSNMNDRTSTNLGFEVPDLSHLELSSGRELSEGALFERNLRKAEREAEGLDLSFFGMLDFNKLSDFKFENYESRVSVRPSFPIHLKWNQKGWDGLLCHEFATDCGEFEIPNTHDSRAYTLTVTHGDGTETTTEELREELATTARKVPEERDNIVVHSSDPAILRPNGSEGLVVVEDSELWGSPVLVSDDLGVVGVW